MIIRRIASNMSANCYIVGSEQTKDGLIVDPGGGAEAILDEVNKLGLKIKLIVITHSHPDHLMALAPVKKALGAPFAIHQAEADSLSGGMMAMHSRAFGGSEDAPPQPEVLLKEGDVIEVGELRFTVLHTPGHSPGGICLYGEGVVFSGDTLFAGSIGRTDFPGCSHPQLMESIHTKLMALPDDTVVLPGHMGTTTIGDERQHNPFIRGDWQ